MRCGHCNRYLEAKHAPKGAFTCCCGGAPAAAPVTVPAATVAAEPSPGIRRMDPVLLVLAIVAARLLERKTGKQQAQLGELAGEYERRRAAGDAPVYEQMMAAAESGLTAGNGKAAVANTRAALLTTIDAAAIRRRLLRWQSGKTVLCSGVAPRERRTRLGGFTYVVWRLARFNGGVDVRMPIEAGGQLEDHKATRLERAALELLSEQIAREIYGAAEGGVGAWAQALT